MKRWTRVLIAAAAAGSLSACEHLGATLADSAVFAIGESLTDQGCADRYHADLSSRARCDLDHDGW